MLYAPPQRSNVLQLGCGDSNLYGHMRRCCASYIGVDFSAAMLSKFKARFPEMQLVCAVARLPCLGSPFDFIFSRQVCQYLDRDILRRNLEQVRSLVAPDGVYLLADIPDAEMRLLHYAEAIRGDRDTNWLRGIRRLVSQWVRRKEDGLGNGYSRRTLYKLASECGFVAQTYSAAGCEYRFHAALRRNSGHG